MSDKERYVLDTNIIVSALLFEKSLPGQVFNEAMARGKILVSSDLVTELNTVLARPKFDKYVLPEERSAFLLGLLDEVEVVDVSESIQACRDAKDNKLLELAVCGDASCLITGDADLTTLNPFREIPILTPREFLQELITPSEFRRRFPR